MTRYTGLCGATAVLLAAALVVGCRRRDNVPEKQGATESVRPATVETPEPGPAPVAPLPMSDAAPVHEGIDAEVAPASNPFTNLATEELRAKLDALSLDEQAVQQRAEELKLKWREGNAPADADDALREADYRALNEQTLATMVERTLLEEAMNARVEE